LKTASSEQQQTQRQTKQIKN